MGNIKKLTVGVILGLSILSMSGCGTDGVPLSGSQTHRGEADGTNPVRGVTIQNFCQTGPIQGDKNVDTTINNTNNCVKQNDSSTSSDSDGG